MATDNSLFRNAWVMVLAIAASLMSCFNFVLGFGKCLPRVNPGIALLGGVMLALTPFLVAAGFGRFGNSRTWHSFFKIAGMVSLLPFLYVILWVIPWQGVAQPRLEIVELPLKVVAPRAKFVDLPLGVELPLEYAELPPDDVELPSKYVELPPDAVELPPE